MVNYIPILIIIVFALLIACLIVGASSILGNKISQKTKLDTYECGMRTIGPTRMKMNIRYYLTAMLFLIFDIEIMFLYPWALVTGNFDKLAGSARIERGMVTTMGSIRVPR